MTEKKTGEEEKTASNTLAPELTVQFMGSETTTVTCIFYGPFFYHDLLILAAHIKNSPSGIFWIKNYYIQKILVYLGHSKVFNNY